MRGFLSFLVRYHFALLFIILQAISFFWIISYNEPQKTIFINSSGDLIGNIEEKRNNFSEYLSLKEENEILRKENANLHNALTINFSKNNYITKTKTDSVLKQKYEYTSCKVIQSSIFKTKNYLTLNIGKKQGVKTMDAVISNKSVVGLIKTVGDNFSVVLPIINTDFNLSCKLNHNGYFGSLLWDGDDHKTAKLKNIPLHVSVHKGDSLFTTGYSLLFPSELYIGRIKSFKNNSGESFYDIDVNLAVDFQKLQSVLVVSNLFKQEIDSLTIE